MTDSQPALVQHAPPEISEVEAAALARTVFGVEGTARALGSNQDRNFVIDRMDAAPLLLKIANPGTTAAELEAQSRAARLIAERTPVRVPSAHPFADGTSVREVALAGASAPARLLDFVPGATLSGSRHLSRAAIGAIGRLAASVDRALADFADAGADRVSQWDLRHAAAALHELLPSVADGALRRRLHAAAQVAGASVAPHAAALPMQVVHGDLTDDNVVTADSATGIPDGVIDLGDLNRTWRVGELAITVSSLLHHDGVAVPDALAAVTAYHGLLPLDDAELEALWPLVVLRAAVLVASAHHVLRTDPGNAYAAENLAHEQAIFDAATSLPLPVATALVRRAAGGTPAALALPAHGPLLSGIDRAEVAVLDLSATSPLLHEGRWLADGMESALAAEALAGGARLVATRFGEPRLTRSRPGQGEPCNAVLGVELAAQQEVELIAPWAGVLTVDADGAVTLAADGVRLRIAPAAAPSPAAPPAANPAVTPDAAPVAPPTRALTQAETPSAAPEAADSPTSLNACHLDGAEVEAGQSLGSFAGTVQVTVDDGTELPVAVAPSLLAAWRTVAADPTALLPIDAQPADRPDPAALLAQRQAHYAEVQEHYFADPPVMVRGWREHLVDADGRVYLDALNNVTSIGHAHPRLVEAVAEQWRLLNTNSRFHYPAVAQFADRLAALLPEGLDQVFLVNSGSEAVDLALRLAQAHTGRRDILAVREAYHGWTYLTDAVSTSVADNPNALATRPAWVHTVDAPNGFRGPHADDPARYAADAVAVVERLAAAGTAPAAFLAESLYGNAGGIALPDRYLEAVYEAVRRHGGVAVADEVQVGYGRLGHWLWGFEQQGVVPDIVAVAKAMGNGHPLGAVITTAEIAASYRTQGYFFSSAGGSPVSSAVGVAVLDVIRDEQLQRNAAEVGDYLKARLQELGTRHPILGTVHGSGFYLGPEFVRDPVTLEPATEETAAICERMRRLGVMIQPTGDHQNVLKIKPPMVFTRASADQFVAALDRVLSTGW